MSIKESTLRFTPAAPAVFDRMWLRWWALVLLVYAVVGKGASYIGVAPLYLGEFTLLTGILIALGGAGHRAGIFRSPITMCVLAVIAWGVVGTIPNIPEYGFVALRDAVLWGYGLLALVVALIAARQPDFTSFLLRSLRIYAVAVVLIAPVVYLIGKIFSESIPRWPGANFHLLYHKPGDVMVHLAVVYAAVTCGAVRWRAWPWALLWCLAALSVAPFNRGGTLVLILIGVLCLFPRGANRRWPAVILGCAAVMLAILAISGLRIEFKDFNRREISFQQISENMFSLVGGEAAGNQADTTRWRLDWWNAIIERLPEQDKAWTGLGFGPNIARSFMIMDTPDEVRSPHNVGMTIYARMGLVGVLTWGLMLVFWFRAVASARTHARHNGDQPRLALLTTLMIAMPGLLLNACVDIYLEGPAGGVWFWSLIGVGIALSLPAPMQKTNRHTSPTGGKSGAQ